MRTSLENGILMVMALGSSLYNAEPINLKKTPFDFPIVIEDNDTGLSQLFELDFRREFGFQMIEVIGFLGKSKTSNIRKAPKCFDPK